MLNRESVLELLTYVPSEGKLFWRVNASSRARIGDEAGTPDEYGYTVIRIAGKGYKAHRLVWLIETGSWPEGQLDHRDEDKANNRFGNLRVATQVQQMLNITPANSTSTSGYRGVSWFAQYQKWKGTFMFRGVKRFVGHFDCPKEAYEAVQAAKLKLVKEIQDGTQG